MKITVSFSQLNHNITNQISKNEQEKVKNKAHFKNTNSGENINVVYQKCEWTIDPYVLFISGKISSSFVCLSNINEIVFDLSSQLTTDSVIYHGNLLNFSNANNLLHINLNQTINSGTLDSLTVIYHGIPEQNNFGSFVQTFHSTAPIIWTLSEPYGAKDWWPCKQTLNDKIDSIDIFVKTPVAYSAASNGILISESMVSNQKITHWKHRFPIAAYLVAIAVTNYSVFDLYVSLNNGDSVKVSNYVYPESLQNATQNLSDVIPVMQIFNQLLIDYPFATEKYGHAEFEQGGGMEHQTMTFITDFDHETITHELAHQWFGDFITCKSWSELWLNEGFATYFTGLSYEHMFNQFYWLPWKTMQIEDITSEPDGSVFVIDTLSVERLFSSRLTYRKAGMLLHMLRWEIGDNAFFNAIRNYLNDSELQNSFATTNDLKFHFEQVADTNLNEFFNDWYFGEGFPYYIIDWNQDFSGLVQISISQQTSHSSVDFFEMTIPIQLKGLNQDTIIKLRNSYSGETFFFNPGFSVNELVLDPEKWIVTKNPVINKVAQNNQIQEITIFPNPSSSDVNIFSSENIEIYSAEIKNITGEKLIEKKFLENESKMISILDLQNGTYLVLLETKLGTIVKPVIKIE